MAGEYDLRYIKVEEALRTALLDILEHKRLEDVTVSEICKQARCSRNAFYGHYKGRDELCAAMLNDFADSLRQACAEENERLRAGSVGSVYLTRAAVIVFREHEQLLRVLLRSDTGVFASSLRRILIDVTTASLEELTGGPLDAQARLANAYAAGGVISLIEWWFQEDLPYDQVKIAFEAMQVPVSEALRKTAGILSPEEALKARLEEVEGAPEA